MFLNIIKIALLLIWKYSNTPLFFPLLSPANSVNWISPLWRHTRVPLNGPSPMYQIVLSRTYNKYEYKFTSNMWRKKTKSPQISHGIVILIHWVLIWSVRHEFRMCACLLRTYVTHRFVRRRRARDRNTGARINRALQLTASSDINTQKQENGVPASPHPPGNRHGKLETYIDFIAHSCTWRETIPGGKYRVSVAKRNRGKCPGGCAGKTFALFSYIISCILGSYYITPECRCNIQSYL